MSATSDLLVLDWCSHAAADFAVRHYHYSRSLPPPPHNAVGVWEGGRFIGCVLFARGASASLMTPYGLTRAEGCELVRVALTAHITPVSRIIRIAIKLLRQRSPGLRLLISFADPAHGHVGAIYQAMNWIYTGTSVATTEYLGPDGKIWHNRMVSASGRKKVYGQERAVYRIDQCTKIRRAPKHRYLLPLDKAMAVRLEVLRQPYPKLAGEAETALRRGHSDPPGEDVAKRSARSTS